MRKFYTNYVLPAAVFAVSLLSYGCVDREYSLDNIDGGGSISVGDVITTPPVTAHLTFEGILGGMDEVERILEENGLSFEDIGFVEMYIGEELFLVNLPLDIPLIPEGMTDTFLPEGDDKVEKYPLMFTDTDCLVLNKYDMLPYFDFDEARVQANYETVNPGAPLFRISSRTGDGIQELADFISEQIRKAQS